MFKEKVIKMGTQQLQRGQTLNRPLDEVFAFFADAGNLQLLTPPGLHFEILTPQPIRMFAGALIDYRLQLFGVPFGWQTLISRWQPPHCFVDEQLRGPYKRWVHTHRFRQVAGGTEVVDQVDYQLPLAPFGNLAQFAVARQLQRIFDYRQQVLLQRFS